MKECDLLKARINNQVTHIRNIYNLCHSKNDKYTRQHINNIYNTYKVLYTEIYGRDAEPNINQDGASFLKPIKEDLSEDRLEKLYLSIFDKEYCEFGEEPNINQETKSLLNAIEQLSKHKFKQLDVLMPDKANYGVNEEKNIDQETKFLLEAIEYLKEYRVKQLDLLIHSINYFVTCNHAVLNSNKISSMFMNWLSWFRIMLMTDWSPNSPIETEPNTK